MSTTQPDELCQPCSAIDLYSLFTGPRYFPHDAVGKKGAIPVAIGTLSEVLKNTRCPLCRLSKHELFSGWSQETGRNRLFYSVSEDKQPDPSRVRCFLYPVRAGYGEVTKYQVKNTEDHLATRVEVHLRADKHGCGAEEKEAIREHARGNGFKLLSPSSVDPRRPLQNGYRATSYAQSLSLLSDWINTCKIFHGDTCGTEHFPQHETPRRIRLINVAARTLVDSKAEACTYAALSYVWGQKTEEYIRLADDVQQDEDGIVRIPSTVPAVIEDAMEVCEQLEIPFLWADLYCVDQNDPVRKAADIRDMGMIYQEALITFVAGLSGSRLSHAEADDQEKGQRIETIHGKTYITDLNPNSSQLQACSWNQRGWTYQEGAVAQRIAFFGADVFFICGAGFWRSSNHSGVYGHSAHITDLDLRSNASHLLSIKTWMQNSEWSFGDFVTLVSKFAGRKLSYESDKLNCVSGCLHMLGQHKGMQFVYGLPSIDFHYALLWRGEEDRLRPGFPTWSWAGWHSRRQDYLLEPDTGSSGNLRADDAGVFRSATPPTTEITFGGLLLNRGIENPTPKNRCSQIVANLLIQGQILTIHSDIAHFSAEFVPSQTGTETVDGAGSAPSDVDGQGARPAQAPILSWEQDRVYESKDIRLVDVNDNICQEYFIWFDHWPFVRLNFPQPPRGSTLTWLFRDGIDLVKIVEVKLLEGDDDLRPFHHVLCLGIDRSGDTPGRGRRYGMFCLSGEMWARASPRKGMVELV